MNNELVSWKISDSNGNPISGITPYGILRRISDNFIFDWNDITFKSNNWITKQVTLTETNSTNIPGVYEVSFDISMFNNGFYQFYGFYQGVYGQTSEYEFNIVDGSISSLSTLDNINIINIPSLVRNELSSELAHVMVLQNGMGLDTSQAIMLLEIYRLYGLDPTRPLFVSDTIRTAGDLKQTITATNTSTTVQRN